jgi:hypothetical protein
MHTNKVSTFLCVQCSSINIYNCSLVSHYVLMPNAYIYLLWFFYFTCMPMLVTVHGELYSHELPIDKALKQAYR